MHSYNGAFQERWVALQTRATYMLHTPANTNFTNHIDSNMQVANTLYTV